MRDHRFAVWAWAFVAGCLFANHCEAGSCHGTKKPAPAPVVEVVPASSVDVDVSVETSTPANVDANVTVNGQPVAGGPGGQSVGQAGEPLPGGGVSVLDARRNANRAARAAKHAAVQSRRATRAAVKSSEAASQAAIDEAAAQAYGN
jgi:hypothetical protein